MADKPNILLITTDQQHITTLGVNNNKINTPNLDKLAQRGTVFKRTYCPNPTCTPTRASLITGNYASQHGAWSLGTKLLNDYPTLGEEFQKGGYRTALIGKAHFEPLESTEEFSSLESYPTLQDFEFWRNYEGPYYGFEDFELARNHTYEAHVGEHYALWLEEKGCENWRDYFVKPTGNMSKKVYLSSDPEWQIPEEYHYDAWISERTNQKLEEYHKNGDNFFLWASFLDPHSPCVLPEPWASMYDPEDMEIPDKNEREHDNNPPYFKYVQSGKEKGKIFKNIMNGIKTIFRSPKLRKYYKDFKKHGQKRQFLHGMHPQYYNKKKLKKKLAAYYGMVSLLDKYVGKIIDKLEELDILEETIIVFTTDHGDFFGQHGLITKGPFNYEDLLNIPFIISYPKAIPKQKISDALISLIDLPPTFLDYANLPIPEYMTGINQRKVFEGRKKAERDHILCEMHHSPEMVNMKSYVNQRYKITVHNNQTYGELYDLEKDPEEHHNVWDDPEYQEIKNQLLEDFMRAELEKDYRYLRNEP